MMRRFGHNEPRRGAFSGQHIIPIVYGIPCPRVGSGRSPSCHRSAFALRTALRAGHGSRPQKRIVRLASYGRLSERNNSLR